MVARVPHGRKGQTGEVVAIVFNLRANDVGFVPHRRLSVGHVSIVAKEDFAGGGLVLPNDPGVGPEPLGNGAQGIQFVHAGGNAGDV